MQPPRARWLARLALLLAVSLVLAACDFPGLTSPNATPTAGGPPAVPTAEHPPSGTAPGTLAPGGLGAPGGQPAGQPPGQVQSQGTATVASPNPPPPAPTSPPPGRSANAVKDNLKGWIAYVGLDNDIWIMPQAANTWRRIIAKPAAGLSAGSTAQRLAWAPSGRRLLYAVALGAGDNSQWYVWDADSGQIYDLGAAAPGDSAAWLPDSVHVALARGNPSTVVVRDIEHGTDVSLGAGSSPAWMPPAGTCAATSTAGAIAVVRSNNIWLIDYPPHAGGERQLTKYGAPSGGGPAYVADTQYLWNCQALFAGDPTGGLGAQLNGMAVWAVNLRTGQSGTTPLIERGGRIQQLAVAPSGNYLGLTEDTHVNACIAAGDARVYTIAGKKVADVPLPFVQQAYHAHMYGLSFSPRGQNSLVVSYSQNYCDSPDPATFHSPIGPRILLLDLNAPAQAKYIGDGAWPAWNGGMLGLGTAPDPQEAAR